MSSLSLVLAFPPERKEIKVIVKELRLVPLTPSLWIQVHMHTSSLHSLTNLPCVFFPPSQWARTATRESGASTMPSCSEPYPPHTPPPGPTFPVWPSHLGSGASGGRRGCSWPSSRTCTVSPTANSAGSGLEDCGFDLRE